jgi:peptide deformylase
MKLEIRKYPDPVLSKKAEKIKNPLSEDTQRLISDMAETLQANNNGIGLAAPQVGSSLRLCIIELEGTRYVLINPKITAKSGNKEIREEGCLSFPGEFYLVPRYQEVQVRYIDENGKARKLRAQGLLARVVQHETDHLDGILFIKRMKKNPQKKQAVEKSGETKK